MSIGKFAESFRKAPERIRKTKMSIGKAKRRIGKRPESIRKVAESLGKAFSHSRRSTNGFCLFR